MKYIKVEWNTEWRGFWTDPNEYLARLAEIEQALPAGAREFVSQPGHYDFGSSKCVKDLSFNSASFAVDQGACVEVQFDPNEWKHESGLVINYTRVSRVSIVAAEVHGLPGGMGEVLLDEILPIEGGCLHEIALTGGTIAIWCADLNAQWR